MNDNFRIPPIQLPITTIATNITQTPQTPLEAKVALTKQESVLYQEFKKVKKDHVEITEQQWEALKQRSEFVALRDLQTVFLFSHLLSQGLQSLEQSVATFLPQLDQKAIEEIDTRQALPGLYHHLLQQAAIQIEPIEHQLAFLHKIGPHLLEQSLDFWQVKAAEQTYPSQKTLTKLLEQLNNVSFPDTATLDEQLTQNLARLKTTQALLHAESKQLKDTAALLKTQTKKTTAAEKKQTIKQKTWYYWRKNLLLKTTEQKNIQEKIRQMEFIHPLKRKQSEYQAYLLRNKIIEQELQAIHEEEAQALLNSQTAQAEYAELLESTQTLQTQLKTSEETYQTIERTIQTETKATNEFVQTHQAQLQSCYEQVRTQLMQQQQEIQNEQIKAQQLATDYRQQVTATLNTLKQIFEQNHNEQAKNFFKKTKKEFNFEQNAILLSQANADAQVVEDLLNEKK